MTGAILWLTGLPRAGKSTLARAIAELAAPVRAVEVLDGDRLRAELSPDLGYTRAERDSHVRRVAFLARLLARHGVLVIVAVIAPYAATRREVRQRAEEDGTLFIEVFADAAVDALIARDASGLYRRALAGEIPRFTGVSDPYEPPEHPDIHVRTDRESLAESVATVHRALVQRGILPSLRPAGTQGGQGRPGRQGR